MEEEAKPVEATPEPAAPSPAASASVPASEVTVPLEHILMPSARHLSQSKGVDATGLQGTGKGGRITKGDVLQAFKDGIELPPLASTVSAPTSTTQAASSAAPAAIPAPVAPMDVTIPTITASGNYTDVKNNNMRKVIAKRLKESKS